MSPADDTQPQLSKDEYLKLGSRQLRGTIAEELQQDTDHFSAEATKLTKYHGFYQQDNRDDRKAKNADGTRKGKSYIMMVRSRVPGGKVTAEQFLSELDLCERFGNGTLRVTTRQGFQLHGVLKKNVKATIREINRIKLSTLAACGDVERNVMCCPEPHKGDSIRDEMQSMADRVAEHLKPRTSAYYEIWLEDESGEKTDVTEFKPVDEPLYGKAYLPRKFKTAFALPEDNCIDIHANDLGFLTIVEDGKIVGYNVLVGGGMGTIPSAEKSFPAVSLAMTFVPPDQVLAVAEAVVKVQRDFGNREDRKVARLKYLIHDWGLDRFKAKVEEYYGGPLPEPKPVVVTNVDDHIGWREQGDGKLYLGINIDSGRIKDEGDLRLKTALRTILQKYGMRTRLTPLQSVILCDIDPKDQADIDQILAAHGVLSAEQLSPLRRYAMACPAMPTCGLSVAESERVLLELIAAIEVETAKYGLGADRLAVHMTGCPNGCARPYTPDIGIVGKTLGKYTVFLGGNVQGTRLAFIYDDVVPFDEIPSRLSPVFALYKAEREEGESFGDFCHRVGQERITKFAEEFAAAS